MASKKHDFIVSAIVRKARKDGFKIAYLDGDFKAIDTIKPEMPPKIIHHKPDVVGEKENGVFCIGEAKTQSDIFSERTKNQMRDFMKAVELNPRNKLIVGVPENSKGDLERLLSLLGFINHRQIEKIYIPEKLLPYEEEV